ncbi:MAG TPA: DUF1259 domain-containing protein [Candidatus Polarisedimenticolia bacterium]|nr:DUF1259 domain-containing protein [Candidatus Polarisedimenticolia bacterium]
MTERLRFLTLICVLTLPTLLRAQGVTTAPIDQALGRSGQKTGDVYRVSFPRTDLHVSLKGVAIKPGLALGSWAAFLGTDDNAMVMGDLVLLEEELNPVMTKLRSAGFEISAVHNHLMEESPRILYMHYMGHGPATQLATSLRGALSVSKTPLDKPAAAAEEPTPPAWVKTVEDAVGRKGTYKGGVLSYGVPRSDTITMAGMTITPAAGVGEAINFQATDSGKVATTGDFVLTADEVNPVISALQDHSIQVTALHSHMLTEQPRLFFMHFWCVGSPESVGAGIKAALSKVQTK